MNRLLIMISFCAIFSPLAQSTQVNTPIDQLADGQMGVAANKIEHNDTLNLDEQMGSYIAELIPIIAGINLALAGATTAFTAGVLSVADYQSLSREKRAKKTELITKESEKLADEIQKVLATIKPLASLKFKVALNDLFELQALRSKFQEAIIKADELASAAKKIANFEEQILEDGIRKDSGTFGTSVAMGIVGLITLGIVPLISSIKNSKLTDEEKMEKEKQRLRDHEAAYKRTVGRISVNIIANAKKAEEKAKKIKSDAEEGIKAIDAILSNNIGDQQVTAQENI